jgi:hypothetical protein
MTRPYLIDRSEAVFLLIGFGILGFMLAVTL